MSDSMALWHYAMALCYRSSLPDTGTHLTQCPLLFLLTDTVRIRAVRLGSYELATESWLKRESESRSRFGKRPRGSDLRFGSMSPTAWRAWHWAGTAIPEGGFSLGRPPS